MISVSQEKNATTMPKIWPVGMLCRAIADALEARFNPVAVRGEVSGFTRASSGHCYFTLKDDTGQIRCAMFRRAASLLTRMPREGDQIEALGRLSVYEARGELQMVVESLRPVGQGALFEEFLRLKQKLETEGLFDAARKRPLSSMPRGIGVVTSLTAAAWHDVMTALQRRVPHIPVVLAPAQVQGAEAAPALIRALRNLYQQPGIDVILLVRGGGSMEDLWCFNDEQLARTVADSPVPLISGVGHETDFTLADFCADLRAPTPTAAAELCAAAQTEVQGALALLAERLSQATWDSLDTRAQRIDGVQQRLGRPSQRISQQSAELRLLGQHLRAVTKACLQDRTHQLAHCQARWQPALAQVTRVSEHRLQQAALRLGLLDPKLALRRGYAWLRDESGLALTQAAQAVPGQALTAVLADGEVDLSVLGQRLD